ncbi:SRPBCC family protein [Streptomyces sp. SBT349]|uniref:SRPBCC family protein n=1 Tax=Streptomyces sp. SBT349 TaxID=1580539 RepID=UPI00066BF8B1|nr:SRPBCC family protein [Streptomyces sp. SBT349]
MVEAVVTIRRPPSDVFAFYRDFSNLPRFLGDVMAVELKDPVTSRWTVQGPMGLRVRWTVEVTAERADELIRYRTTGPPGTRGRWAIHFTPGDDPGSTAVRAVMTTPFGGLGRTTLRLIGKPPQAEAAANLRRLKQLMETGEVTDTSHSVPGKFGARRG